MCKWAATNVRTEKCFLYTQGRGDPHEYQELQIWICEDATRTSDNPEVWEPCSNYEGKDGRQGVDIGSTRIMACPVCTREQEAALKCERRIEEALLEYYAELARAEKEKEESIKTST